MAKKKVFVQKITLSGFRSFNKTQEFDIKPLTILLGKNGVGKSSISRLFPMFKQSIESPSTGFLWYGPYVDFGSFKDIKCKNSSENDEVSIQLQIENLDLGRAAHSLYDNYEYYIYRRRMMNPVRLKSHSVKFVIGSKNNAGSYSFIEKISFLEQGIDLEFTNEMKLKKVLVDGENYTDFFDVATEFYTIIPHLRYNYDPKLQSGKLFKAYEILLTKIFYRKKLINDIQFLDSKAIEVFTTLDRFKKTNYYNLLKAKARKNPEILEQDIQKLYRMLKAKYLARYIQILDHTLHEDFLGIRYIAPVRAYIDRYYRYQELSVKEVDPKGANVALYLNSLDKVSLAAFNKWNSKFFNFQITPRSENAHLELYIKNLETNEDRNLADTGFGYSQMLPFLLQIWSSFYVKTNNKDKFRRTKNRERKIVIEQPELHLHPGFQSKLAQIFIQSIKDAKKNDIKLSLIIETHSEAFIEELGKSVKNRAFKSEDIGICIFDQLEGNTTIQSTVYDKDGFIEQWPIGFFTGV